MTEIEREGRWLIVRFAAPQVILSWALQGGGWKQTQTVAWYQVNPEDLKPPIDPQEFLRAKLEEKSLSRAVGLLTSANLDRYVDIERDFQGFRARCVATVGMSNALRVGDPVSQKLTVNTINLLCLFSEPLSFEAQLEALSIAVEARTAAVLEAAIPSIETGLAATGTGTDCVVLGCPASSRAANAISFAGKHTGVGFLVGKVVMETMKIGIRRWIEHVR